MENPNKKRGISLIRHQRSSSMYNTTSFQPSQPKVIYYNYPRYPTSQMVVRKTSAPKSSVQFRYAVNPEGLVPTPIELRHNPLDLKSVQQINAPNLSSSI